MSFALRIVGCLCASALVVAQESATAVPPPAPVVPPVVPPAAPQQLAPGAYELAAATTAAMRLSAPGPEHARLAALAGGYDVAVTLRQPASTTLECRGSAVAATVLGGRWLLLDATIDVGGTKVESICILGFDNLRGVYTASWRDSLSTWAVDCAGSPDPATKDRIQLAGTLADTATPTGRPFRLELTLADDGLVLAVFDTIDGREQEVAHQRFTRTRTPPKATGGDGK